MAASSSSYLHDSILIDITITIAIGWKLFNIDRYAANRRIISVFGKLLLLESYNDISEDLRAVVSHLKHIFMQQISIFNLSIAFSLMVVELKHRGVLQPNESYLFIKNPIIRDIFKQIYVATILMDIDSPQ
jgi:hypothetical protein